MELKIQVTKAEALFLVEEDFEGRGNDLMRLLSKIGRQVRRQLTWECHFFRARVFKNVCLSPKRRKICGKCKFNPKLQY